MQFHSLYFIIFFLPLVLAGYYLTARKSKAASDWFLIAASLVFYGAANLWYPLMLVLLIGMNWGIAGLAGRQHRTETNLKRRKHWMVAGIVLNAGFLGVFKYTNFFLENLNALFQKDWPMVHLLLPLGISFIIFSQISWIVDAYRGEMKTVRFREYVLYSVFFPKISQGPITTMRDFLPQLRKEGRQLFDSEGMVTGIQMFTCGLFKKVIFADPLGKAVTQYYSLFSYRSNVDSLIVMLAYTFQIYFDFSGYSDMAIGLAKTHGGQHGKILAEAAVESGFCNLVAENEICVAQCIELFLRDLKKR